MKKKILYMLLFVLMLLLISCTEGSSDSSDTTMLTIGITDAPIDEADAVNIGINKIEIKKEDSDEWLDYFVATTVEDEIEINLLEYNNGDVMLFDSKEFEAGEYGQIRLYLSQETGKNTILLKNGEEKELEINSGIKNAGLKLVSGFNIVEGAETVLTIDFDVRKSIVVKGGKNNPRYALKPTIKLIKTNTTGQITLTGDIAEEDVFYLYPKDYDVSEEAELTVIDDMGTPDDTSDDEEVALPFGNAVSSAIAFSQEEEGLAVFPYIEFGEYDIYKYDEELDNIELMKSDVNLSEDNSSVTLEIGDTTTPTDSGIEIK